MEYIRYCYDLEPSLITGKDEDGNSALDLAETKDIQELLKHLLIEYQKYSQTFEYLSKKGAVINKQTPPDIEYDKFLKLTLASVHEVILFKEALDQVKLFAGSTSSGKQEVKQQC